MATKSGKSLDVVVLYSSGHLGSAIIMNRLIAMSEINVVGVVKAQPLKLSLRGRSQIKKHLHKVGWRFAGLLFWQRCIQALAYLPTLIFPFLRTSLKPAWKIASEWDIPVFHCSNVNDDTCRTFVSQLNPDLLISAYFSQILKKEIIALPEIGVLNIHPGWLPAYRGAMAYFWVLKNGCDRGGVSVHWINEGIDSGDLLARRSFPLKQNATQETVLTFSAVIGARLIRRIVRNLLAGKEARNIVIDDDEEGSYYPMPGDRDFEVYFKKHRFFRIRDVLRSITMRNRL